MADYQARMRAVEELDSQRRAKRLAAENELLDSIRAKHAKPDVDTYHASRGITGEPNDPHRTHKASDNCWNRGLTMQRPIAVAKRGKSRGSYYLTKHGKTYLIERGKKATRVSHAPSLISTLAPSNGGNPDA
jgi:hypothetical protein